jgi:hypothetical protein
MSPITHFLTGWTLAHVAPLDRRDRWLVTLAGIAPDVDGLGLLAEVATRHTAHPLAWWSDYHHVLGHNLGFALLLGLVALGVAHRRLPVVFLVLLSVHLHFLGDLLGARGPDGEQWPIPYLLPFFKGAHWAWSGQWALNAWPNMLLTAVLIWLTCHLARLRGYSPLEIISARADRVFVETLRRRFPLVRPGNP